MQFSNTTTKGGIIQFCERYTGLGDTGISGTERILRDFTSRVNEASKEVWHLIFMSYGGWQFDDYNKTDLPIATTGLVEDQQDYNLPTGALTIRNVHIKNESGDWHRLKPITKEMIEERQAEDEFFETAGEPLYYSLLGDTLSVYPKPDYTQTASLRITFSRDMVDFEYNDTSDIPGFASPYHKILPLKASYDFLLSTTPDSSKIPRLEKDITKMEEDIKNFYMQQWKQMYPPKIRVYDKMRFSR